MIVYCTNIIFYIIDNQIFIYCDNKEYLTSYFITFHRSLRLYFYLCIELLANLAVCIIASCIFVATNPPA